MAIAQQPCEQKKSHHSGHCCWCPRGHKKDGIGRACGSGFLSDIFIESCYEPQKSPFGAKVYFIQKVPILSHFCLKSRLFQNPPTLKILIRPQFSGNYALFFSGTPRKKKGPLPRVFRPKRNLFFLKFKIKTGN